MTTLLAEALAEYMVPEQPEVTASAPICGFCARPIIGIPQPCTKNGEPSALHLDCLINIEANRRKKEDLLRFRESRVNTMLEQVPRWPHARVGTPEFVLKVQSARLRAFAEKWTWENRSVLLLALSGKGKTSACIALVQRLAAEAFVVGSKDDHKRVSGIIWVKAEQLVNARREHGLGRGTPRLIERAREASLLVVDDLGNEPEDRDRDIYSVVDARYDKHVPTIVTCGLSMAQFTDRYREAFLRKLTQDGIGKLIEV